MPSKKLTRDDFPALLELGKVLPSSLDSEKGIDLVQLINQWTGAVRKGLSEWGAENSFDNLCRAGCSQLSLSLVLFASAISIAFAEKWAKIVGPLRRRERILRALEHAAEALEEITGRSRFAVTIQPNDGCTRIIDGTDILSPAVCDAGFHRDARHTVRQHRRAILG